MKLIDVDVVIGNLTNMKDDWTEATDDIFGKGVIRRTRNNETS